MPILRSYWQDKISRLQKKCSYDNRQCRPLINFVLIEWFSQEHILKSV